MTRTEVDYFTPVSFTSVLFTPILFTTVSLIPMSHSCVVPGGVDLTHGVHTRVIHSHVVHACVVHTCVVHAGAVHTCAHTRVTHTRVVHTRVRACAVHTCVQGSSVIDKDVKTRTGTDTVASVRFSVPFSRTGFGGTPALVLSQKGAGAHLVQVVPCGSRPPFQARAVRAFPCSGQAGPQFCLRPGGRPGRGRLVIFSVALLETFLAPCCSHWTFLTDRSHSAPAASTAPTREGRERGPPPAPRKGDGPASIPLPSPSPACLVSTALGRPLLPWPGYVLGCWLVRLPAQLRAP